VISFAGTILRKQDDLPRYIVVKPEHLAGRRAAFPARVSLDGGPDFARNIRPWGGTSNAFFFNLTADQARRSGLDTGDTCAVIILPET